MRNFTIIKTIKDSDETLNVDYETAVDNLMRDIRNSKLASNTANLTPSLGSIETNVNDQNTDILYDFGNGRISKGMTSLRAISLSILGKVNGSVRQRGVSIIYSSPNVLKTASKELSRKIVLKNLAVYDIILPLMGREIQMVDSFLLLIDNIVVDIKQGKFSINKYKRDVLNRIKKIIQLSTNLFNRGKL